MLKILFTRHGQTIRNVEDIIQGNEHGDLHEKGFEQIKKLADRLQKEKIDFILSSDSSRCKITAEEVAKIKHRPIEYTPLLREKDNGDWVGKNTKKVNWDELEGNFENRKAPHGESLIEVRERGRLFMKKVIEKYQEIPTTILVVSHGAFLKVLIGDLIKTSLKDSIHKLFIDHCSLTLVEFGEKYPEGFQIKYLNETEFLGDSRNWIEF